ncbi:MAG TPA: hypothetical protein VJ851_02035 [Jatrophihabitans sp.]|nr:hypothetical protein [Jatrophihabitans sp.]
MTWAAFDLDTGLERDVLSRALPLVPTKNDGTIRYTVDLASGSVSIAVAVGGVLGATPDKCVELLAIRPLLIGTAWKVLDLLVEAALNEAGKAPDQTRGWSINAKVKLAQQGTRKPRYFSQAAWTALLLTYASTEDIRHSLVHRTVHLDQNMSLIGVNRQGHGLPPLLRTEQDALIRAALRAASLAIATKADPRTENDLIHHLQQLNRLHGIALPTSVPIGAIPEITVPIDLAPGLADRFLLDLPAVRALLSTKQIDVADLVVVPAGRPGQELHGRWEDAPDVQVMIDPDRPPTWLNQ